MSELDTPIQVEEQVVDTLDTPVEFTETELPLEDKKMKDFKASKAAYIEKYNIGSDLVESFYKYTTSPNLDADLRFLSKEKADQDRGAVNQVLEEGVSDPTTSFTEVLWAADDAETERRAKEDDVNYQFVDSLSPADTTEEQKVDVKQNIDLYEILNHKTEQFGALDYVMDVASWLPPLFTSWDDFDLTGQVFNNDEYVRDVILGFKRLPYKEQVEKFPAIVDKFLNDLGPIRGKDALIKFIEPLGEEDTSDFHDAWKIFDAIDIASLGTASVLKAIKLRQATNTTKILNDAGNTKEAAKMNTAALVDEKVSEVTNTKQETAASNAMPFDVSLADPAYSKGMSTRAQQELDNFFTQSEQIVTDIVTGERYLKEGIVTTIERADKESALMDSLLSQGVEDVQIVGRKENTTTFSYKVMEDGKLVDEEFTADLTLNDAGQWNQKEISNIGEHTLSPLSIYAESNVRLDVKAAERMDLQTAKVYNQLVDMQRKALEPLGSLFRPKNRARLKEVERALRAGDEYIDPVTKSRGKVFTVDELKGGQFEFDDDMVSAYYRANRVFNHLWSIRNDAKRQEMIALGHKKVNINGVESSFGKSYETVNDARLSVNNSEGKLAYNSNTNEVVELTTENLEELYDNGYVLNRLVDPYMVDGGRGKFTYILTNADMVEELPAAVLSYRKGYVPRATDNGHWFVKEFGEQTINGATKSDSFLKTHRYFDNRHDAEAYAKQLADEGDGTTSFRALEDREMEIAATALGQFSHGGGGLYTGARAEDALLFGLEGKKGQRIDPYEAMIRNITNVSRVYPINQWRLGLEQRWINTANALFPDQKIEKFGDLPETIEATRGGQFLNHMAKQINHWKGFPTKEEQLFQGQMQRMYEWALGKDYKKLAKIPHYLMDKDPVGAARAYAFHSLLGWFNPVQLWTQAQGMSIAVSLAAGDNLADVMKMSTALSIMGEKQLANPKRAAIASKLTGIPADHIAEVHKYWDKTGLADGILQTADHAAAIRGHGYAMDALKRVSDKGLLFYRAGEFLTRRTAFSKAFLDWKKTSKGKAPTDADLKKILDRTNDMMLNMGKANGAAWQRGITSVPLQFTQITTKALETLMGGNKNFTGAERGRLLAGQLALYGTAGVPLASMGVEWAKQVAGITQEDLDNNPVLVKSLNDGFWGFITLGVFGVDAEVAARGSLVRGVSDFIDNWIYADGSTAAQLTGAFGASQYRFWTELEEQTRPLRYNDIPIEALDPFRLAITPLTASLSTFNNLEKAIIMDQHDAILDRHGGVSLDKKFTLMDKMAQAIGFQRTELKNSYSMQERDQAVRSIDKKFASVILNRMHSDVSLRSAGLMTPEREAETDYIYGYIMNSVDPERREAISRMVQNSLKGESKYAKNVRNYRKRVEARAVSELNIIKATLTGTEQLSIQEEK